MNLAEGLKLIVKVLKKTLDKNKMTGDNSKYNIFKKIIMNLFSNFLVDIFVLQNVNGEITQRFLKADEVDHYLKVIEKEEAEEKANAEKKHEF